MTKVTHVDEFVELISETEDTEFQIENVRFDIVRYDDNTAVAISDEFFMDYGVLSKDDCYLPFFNELVAGATPVD